VGEADPFDPRTWPAPVEHCALWLDDRATRFCILDASDYLWAVHSLWFVTPSGYAARSVRVDGRSTRIWLHKEILARRGPPPSPRHFIGDHLNGDTLNNRRCNLRWATPSENGRNRHGFLVQQPDLFSRYGGGAVRA
jgi:hypothetical protein